MARKKRRQEEGAGELNMVAMIDVAMQLLNFFLITAKPMDVMANLDVFRPSAPPVTSTPAPPPRMLRILVAADGYTINDKYVDMAGMESVLGKLGELDSNQTVLIMVSAASKHESLVRVLDMCSKTKLKNLSVISTN